MSKQDSPTQRLFGDEQLKIMNKLYRVPQWANDPKRAGTDRSLMAAKVRQYILEIGQHIDSDQVPTDQRSKAWDFVAERSSSKLKSRVLERLYSDIADAESRAAAAADSQTNADGSR